MSEIPVAPRLQKPRLSVAISLLLVGLSSPSLAGECRLALVLALDVSSSVDADEDRLQRLGLARALIAPEVVRAFHTADPVGLYVFEWSGPRVQEEVVPGWQMVRGEDDLIRIARLITESERPHVEYPDQRSTALGAALAFAAEALQAGPDCKAQVIDVSGDGEASDGISPALAFATYPLDGVTVNALVIGGPSADGGQLLNNGHLVAYFQAQVLHGSGAFAVLADGYDDYERAMRLKLRREVEMPVMSGLFRFEPQG